MQCTVDSSQELCAALATVLPKQLAQQWGQRLAQYQDARLSLVVVDSICAFYPIDRACTLVPTSPKMPTPPLSAPRTAEQRFAGTNIDALAPAHAATLPHVHTELVRTLRALLRFPVAVFTTMKAASSYDASGLLQIRPYLPVMWNVRF
jgi:hypothetical protein